MHEWSAVLWVSTVSAHAHVFETFFSRSARLAWHSTPSQVLTAQVHFLLAQVWVLLPGWPYLACPATSAALPPPQAAAPPDPEFWLCTDRWEQQQALCWGHSLMHSTHIGSMYGHLWEINLQMVTQRIITQLWHRWLLHLYHKRALFSCASSLPSHNKKGLKNKPKQKTPLKHYCIRCWRMLLWLFWPFCVF